MSEAARPMLDPVLALAFAMHTTRGAYALLLGSGVSRSAGTSRAGKPVPRGKFSNRKRFQWNW